MNIETAFPSKYLRAADLNGAVVPVTIDRPTQQQVGRDRELKPVLYFSGQTKGLVINKTNARKIAELTGEANTDDWAGHRVALFPMDVEFEGKTVPAIRVKAAPVQSTRPPATRSA